VIVTAGAFVAIEKRLIGFLMEFSTTSSGIAAKQDGELTRLKLCRFKLLFAWSYALILTLGNQV